jgi:hypothetical protein
MFSTTSAPDSFRIFRPLEALPLQPLSTIRYRTRGRVPPPPLLPPPPPSLRPQPLSRPSVVHTQARASVNSCLVHLASSHCFYLLVWCLVRSSVVAQLSACLCLSVFVLLSGSLNMLNDALASPNINTTAIHRASEFKAQCRWP